jgi:hypothetical protein
MIAPPVSLVDALKPWSDFYGQSKLTETVVVFVHVGGLLLGGGIAVASDRATLRALALAPGSERTRQRNELATAHRWVLTGIALIVVSGLALVTSDLETFWSSPIYWVKMALVIALLVNGARMTRAESVLARDDSETSRGWRTLHRTAVTSLGLWFVVTALGIALVNFS